MHKLIDMLSDMLTSLDDGIFLAYTFFFLSCNANWKCEAETQKETTKKKTKRNLIRNGNGGEKIVILRLLFFVAFWLISICENVSDFFLKSSSLHGYAYCECVAKLKKNGQFFFRFFLENMLLKLLNREVILFINLMYLMNSKKPSTFRSIILFL